MAKIIKKTKKKESKMRVFADILIIGVLATFLFQLTAPVVKEIGIYIRVNKEYESNNLKHKEVSTENNIMSRELEYLKSPEGQRYFITSTQLVGKEGEMLFIIDKESSLPTTEVASEDTTNEPSNEAVDGNEYASHP